MKQLVPMIAIALLAGCASASYTTQNDGRNTVDCSGMMRDWRTCEKQAALLCPVSGYKIVSTATATDPKVGMGSWTDRLIGTIGFKTPRSMVIACKSGHSE